MRFLRAQKVFNGRKFLPGRPVLAIDDNGILKEIIENAPPDNGIVEELEGIVTPGFVNSHCHLELSHLRHKIGRLTGLPAFGKQVIIQRNNAGAEEIAEHISDADNMMWRNGIVAVGDISNGEQSFFTKTESKLFYHTFIELIGLNPNNCGVIFNNGKALLQKLSSSGLRGSLAPHAPYSTSLQLIKSIADFDQSKYLPLSIHNQESEEENKFFMGEKNGFDALYSFLNLDISWFKAPKCSSLENYAGLLTKNKSILVHNTVTRAPELNLLPSENTFWCFCPNANLYIENKLPNFGIFNQPGIQLVIGTDSLASNDHLDLVAEANVILEASASFKPEDLLRFMTYNGAAALGISDQFGSLITGKNTGLNLISFENNKITFLKKIT